MGAALWVLEFSVDAFKVGGRGDDLAAVFDPLRHHIHHIQKSHLGRAHKLDHLLGIDEHRCLGVFTYENRLLAQPLAHFPGCPP